MKQVRTMGLLCLAGILAVPLFYSDTVLASYVFTQTTLFNALVLASVIPAVVVGAPLATGKEKTTVTMAFAVYIVALVIATLVSVDRSFSFFGTWQRFGSVLDWIYLFVFFIALKSIVKTVRDWDVLFLIQFIVGSAIAVLAVSQRLLSPIVFYTGERVFSSLGNPGFLAGYLLLSLGISVLYWYRMRTRSTRIVVAIGLLIQFSALLLTSTRSAVLGLTIGGLIYAVSQRKKIQAARRSALVLIVLVISIVSAGIFIERLNPFTISGTEISRRVSVWESGIKGFTTSPIVGYGPEMFNYIFFAAYPSAIFDGVDATFNFDDAHNVIINHLAETGLVGTAAYLFLLLAPLYVLWKPSYDAHNRQESIILFSVSVAYYIYLFFFFHSIGDSILFIFILAYIDRVKKSDTIDVLLPRWFFPSVAVLCLGVFTISALKPLAASSLARSAERTLPLVERNAYYIQALELTRSGDYDILRSFNRSLPLPDGSVDAFLIHQSFLSEALSYIERHETSIIIRMMAGESARTLSFYESEYLDVSEALYSTVVDLAPTYPFVYQQRGLVRLDRALLSDSPDLAQVREDFNTAYELAPNVFSHSILRALPNYLETNDSTDLRKIITRKKLNEITPREWVLLADMFELQRDVSSLEFLLTVRIDAAVEGSREVDEYIQAAIASLNLNL